MFLIGWLLLILFYLSWFYVYVTYDEEHYDDDDDYNADYNDVESEKKRYQYVKRETVFWTVLRKYAITNQWIFFVEVQYVYWKVIYKSFLIVCI